MPKRFAIIAVILLAAAAIYTTIRQTENAIERPAALKNTQEQTSPQISRDQIAKPAAAESSKIPNVEDIDPWGVNLRQIAYEVGSFGPKGTESLVLISETESEHRYVRYEFSSTNSGKSSVGGRRMVADHIIVRMAPQVSFDEQTLLLDAIDSSIKKVISEVDSLYAISVPNFESPAALPRFVNALNKLPELIDFAEPDYLVSVQAIPNDPGIRKQWTLDAPLAGIPLENVDINAANAWSLQNNAAQVIVAVIDSGAKTDHPDLGPNLWNNPKETSNGIDDDNNGYIDDIFGINTLAPNNPPEDDNGHGTAVASVIGAKSNNGKGIAGVAWNVQLMTLRFLNKDGFGSISDSIEAIDYAIANGAHIINASWGGRDPSLGLERAIERANQNGILFVTAAGNEERNLDYDVAYPASYDLPNLISVAASNQNGVLSSYSNYGSNSVDIAAPGDDVPVLSHIDDGEIPFVSGTSIAAPHVSGAAALVVARFGEEDPASLKSRIILSAEVSDALYSQVLSHGLLNLERLIKGQTNHPSNDTFSNAQLLPTSSSTIYLNTELAGFEESEPNPFSQETPQTLWYKLRFTQNTKVKIEADLWTSTVYQGDQLTNLTKIHGPGSEYTLTANQDYFVQISTEVSRRLKLEVSVPPANDDFNNAILIQSAEFDLRGNNRFASMEESEPRHHSEALRASVWWKYECPITGYLNFSTAGSQTRALLNIYKGDSLPELTSLGLTEPRGTVGINVIEGETYYLAVDSRRYPTGDIRISGTILQDTEFAKHPQSTAAEIGRPVFLSAFAVGPPPIRYEWYKDGVKIPNAESSSYRIDSFKESDLGDYYVKAISPQDSAISSTATIRKAGRIPQIIQQPVDTDVIAGEPLKLHSVVKGPGNIAFKWYRNGIPVPQQPSSTLELINASISDSGVYHIEASNEFGTATSYAISVVVNTSDTLFGLQVNPRHDMNFAEYLVSSGGKFYAIAERSESFQRIRIMSSNDGFTWEETTLGDDLGINNVYAVGADAERILLATDHGRISSYNTSTGEHYWKNPQADGLINSIVFGNGIVLATTEEGEIIREKEDGRWEIVAELGDNFSNHVVFANGLFLTVSQNNETFSFSKSTDGAIWEPTSSLTTQATFDGRRLDGAGNIFAFGDQISSDGENWIPSEIPISSVSLVYAEGAYYSFQDGSIYKSTDGVNWNAVYELNRVQEIQFLSVGDGTFVFGRHHNRFLAVSDFASPIPEFAPPPRYTPTKIQFVNGFWIKDQEMSFDGKTWIKKEQLDYTYLPWFYGNGIYVAGPHSIGTTPENIKALPHSRRFIDEILAFGSGLFIGRKDDLYYTSPDATEWTQIGTDLPDIKEVVYSQNLFIGIKDGGYVHGDNISYSSDGLDWNKHSFADSEYYPIFLTKTPSGIAVSNVKGRIALSENGTDWTFSENSPVEEEDYAYAFEYSNGIYFLAARNSVYISTDLAAWTRKDLHYNSSIEEIIDGTGATFAINEDEQILLLWQNNDFAPTLTKTLARQFKGSVGQKHTITIEADGLSEIEKIDFLVDGQLEQTSTDPHGKFSWTPQQEGDSSIEIRVTDVEGRTSKNHSLIETRSNRIRPAEVTDVPKNVVKMTIAFNSVYCGTEDGKVYRSEDNINWSLAYDTFSENEIGLLEYSNGNLFAHDSNGLHITNNGIDWKFIQSDYGFQILGKWLIQQKSNSQGMRFSQNGLDWFDHDQNLIFSHAFGEQLIGKETGGTPIVINPGNSIKTIQYPENHELRELIIDDFLVFGIFRSNTGNGIKENLYRTHDLINWEQVELPSIGENQNSSYIQKFQTTGDLYAIQIGNDPPLFSRDLINWKTDDNIKSFNQVFQFDGQYYLSTPGFQTSGTHFPASLHRSKDGLEWSLTANDERSYEDYFATQGGLIRWDDRSSHIGQYAYSSNGSDWKTYHFGYGSGGISSIAYGKGIYVAPYGGDYTTNTGSVLVSDDGENWTQHDGLPSSLGQIVFGNDVFVATVLGRDRSLSTSANAIDWEIHDIWTFWDNNVESLVYHPPSSKFFATNSTNHYFSSTDGISWSEIHIVPDRHHRSLSIVGNRLYMEAGSNEIYSSEDGINWEKEGPTEFRAELFWDGYYWGKNDWRDFHRSIDGINSEPIPHPIQGDLIDMMIIENEFIARFGSNRPNSYSSYRLDQNLNWSLVTDLLLDGVRYNPTTAKDFLLKNGILSVINTDLSLESVIHENGQFKFGGTISATVEIRNRSSESLSLNGIRVGAKLATEQGWLGSKKTSLREATLPHTTINAGETKSILVEFEVDERPPPGLYGLQVHLNPDQGLEEISYQNNYAWSDDASIEFAARSLNLNSNSGGSVESIPAGPIFSDGESVTIIAKPSSNYRVKGWSGIGSSNLNTHTITMDRDIDVEVEFERVFTPEFRIRGKGTINVTPDNGSYAIGDEIAITAIPDPGWSFFIWSGSENSSQELLNISVTGELNLTANFTLSYDSWESHFLTTLDPDDKNRLPGSDPDSDGTSNLMEFLQGSDPLTYNQSIQYELDGTEFKIRYQRSKNVTDFQLHSVSLNEQLNWTSEGINERVLSENEETQLIESSIPLSTSSKPKLVKLEAVPVNSN